MFRDRNYSGKSSDLVGSAEAKTAYFLTPDDLRLLSFQAFGGGIGCGAPRHFYHAADLLAAAIRKHGQAGFEKKQQARQQRESKKRQREGDADQALAEFLRAPRPPAPVAVPGPGASSAAPVALADDHNGSRTVAVIPQEIAALRKSLLKLSKQALAFTESGGPKAWRVEVPGIQRNMFAALADRSYDAELCTFVKAGAYYSHTVDALALFTCKEEDMLRVFKRQGVGLQIYETITLKYKPSDMTLTLHGHGEIICDERTM